MFQSDLVVRAGRECLWILAADLVWVGRETIVVPIGFQTDLASVPAPLRAFLNPNGKSRKPAVLHDWAYSTHLMNRRGADDLFRTALAAERAVSAARFIYWAGVRIGGLGPWRKHEKESTK